MSQQRQQVELDGLRLIGLGRIERCRRCPRYTSLVEHYVNSRVTAARLDKAPVDCPHHYCAPVARRYEASPPQLALLQARAAS